MHDVGGGAGTPLRISLWNLLYRVVNSNDHSRTAWSAVLRGASLSFFKKTLDDLPLDDNEASRRALKEAFFSLPDHGVCDLFEFLLADERAGLKEVDRKLVRRRMNRVLEEEGAPVRLLRDRFVPLPDELGLDAVSSAGETISLFDMAAASRHLQSAVSYLSRRPEPATQEAVREAVLAVAAVVRSLDPEPGGIAVGTIASLADRLGVPEKLREGIEATLAHCRAGSGLPGSERETGPADLPEAAFLVVFCSSLVHFLLARTDRRDRRDP